MSMFPTQKPPSENKGGLAVYAETVVLFGSERVYRIFLCRDACRNKSRNKRKHHTDRNKDKSRNGRQLRHIFNARKLYYYRIYREIQQDGHEYADNTRRESHDKRFSVEHTGNISF